MAPKQLDNQNIESIVNKYGESFYLLDSDVFEHNCNDLLLQ